MPPNQHINIRRRDVYLYVELWRARQEWWDKLEAERVAYLGRIMQSVESTKQAGAELVGFALNQDDTPNWVDFTYLAAWRMDDHSAVEHQDNDFVNSS